MPNYNSKLEHKGNHFVRFLYVLIERNSSHSISSPPNQFPDFEDVNKKCYLI